MMSEKLKIAVLVSGSGSNLQAIIDQIESGRLAAEIGVVVSNAPEAYALKRASRHNLPASVVNHRDFPSREAFEAELVKIINSCEAKLVVLAGFMRVLSPFFVRSFPQRIINIHPALLPSFPGVHAQKQALDYGVRVSGCTVHFVDEGVDTGQIIIQAAVPVYQDDTEETLSERILREEHRILPEAIALYAAGRLKFTAGKLQILPSGRCVVAALHNPPLAHC